MAIADQAAGHDLGLLNPTLYALQGAPASGLVDVTHGNNSFTFYNASDHLVTVDGFSAGPGYDLASGLGTIWAPDLVDSLAD